MRKLLLAGAAIAGASVWMLGVAAAQTLPGSDTQGALPTKPSAGAYAFDNNNNSAAPLPGPIANPTPGSMVIRLGVRVDTGITAAWSNLNQVGSSKLYPYNFQEYMRIYPGMDAMAANGLRYGGAVELRQNYTASPAAELGANGGTAYTSTQTVFVRREFFYLAGDNWGIVRIGEADGLIGTYDGGGQTTGVFLSPSGTIVGGNLQSAFPGNAWMAPYFGAQSGNEYGNLKAVYMSPSFDGFDFGVQYAPNPWNGYAIGAPGACSSAAGDAGCPTLSSSTTAGTGSRMKDQLALGVRYDGPVGPAHLLAYGVWMTSGHVNYNGGVPAGGLVGSSYNGQFDGLNLGMFGANVTYAGFSVFGNVMIGRMNGVLALDPKGAPRGFGWGAGVRYAVGPYTIGGVYSQYDDQGDVALTGISQRHANVFTVAGTYTVAPGLTFYADYIYGTQHQGDFNFATGAHNGGFNNVSSQGVMIGSVVKW